MTSSYTNYKHKHKLYMKLHLIHVKY